MSDSPETVTSAAKLALMINRLRVEHPDTDILLSEPIAVVGMACRFPGGVSSVDEFWRFLRGGSSAIREIPTDRWDVDQYYSSDLYSKGKMNTRWGGFLDDIDKFDPWFFGISRLEAASIDPQQRLLLEVGWEALWDAGIAPDQLGGTSTGVFVGVYGSDQARLLLRDSQAIGPHTCAGTAHSMTSGRLSFLLNLRGPSISVDTACSSSLVSVLLACQSLRAGSCRLAIAGGVSLKLLPEHYLSLSKLGVTSPDGTCRTFDVGANGFVPGEGCGIVILKPLIDALAERCRIYAVVRGTAANQDGRTSVLTAPNGLAQQDVIRSAIRNARISPADISYVETHGTGTALGDPIEVEALVETIGKNDFGDLPCALGSVKTNIGHLEAASGIAGFIKAALALHHNEIPPNLHFQKLNPHVSLEETRLFVPVATVPWPRSDRVRFAGVSSFGFSGTNSHVILEEAPIFPNALSSLGGEHSSAFLIPISARSAVACDAFARNWQSFLDEGRLQTSLYDLSHSASVRRSHYEERLAITANSSSDLHQKLDDYLAGRSNFSVLRGRAINKSARIVFVFSGFRAQWSQMGLHLYARFPVFRASLDECDAQIRRISDWSLIEVLSFKDRRLTQGKYAQPAIFAIEVSMCRLFQSWGIQPSMVIGHDVGEVAAAHIAGVLSLEVATRLAVIRGKLWGSKAKNGKMAVIDQGPVDAANSLSQFGERISITSINGRCSTVISGEPGAIDALVAQLGDVGVASSPLPAEFIVNGRDMETCGTAFLRELGSFSRQSIKVPLISTVTGSRVVTEEIDADYWARNLIRPALLPEAVEAATAMGAAIYLGVGPDPMLVDWIQECSIPKLRPGALICSMRPDVDELVAIFEALGKLYVSGCSVDWKGIYQDVVPPVNLPVYPYQRQSIRA
jgi:acyl transferase domain-containing protein